MKHKILILYDEIMGYIESGIISFLESHNEVEVHIFEKDFSKITNYNVSPDELYFYYKKSEFLNYKLFLNKCIDISPDILIVSGRVDNQYLNVAKYFKKKIFTVTIQDTQFQNSLKQKIQIFFSEVLYKKYFSGYWGCGISGTYFAKRLGFDSSLIFRNAYSANTKLFKSEFNRFNNKKILFVGRLVPVKNVEFLINNFIKANSLNNNEWELIIIGNGPFDKSILKQTNIKHFSFMSQIQLQNFVNNIDIFCLPSIVEPWGVVVHEFASRGLPLLLSKNVGSASEFLINGYNGFSFDPESSEDFIEKLSYLMKFSTNDLSQLGQHSIILAKRISTEIWAATLFEILLTGLKTRKI